MSTPREKPQEQHEVGAPAEETITDLEFPDEAADKVGGGAKVNVDKPHKTEEVTPWTTTHGQ